jgi:hypothetical protein
MLWLLLVALTPVLTPRSASAYVREVTTIGMPVAWKSPCISMHLFLGNPPQVLTADQVLQAGQQAASVWSQPTLACTDLRLMILSAERSTADVLYDHRNIISFRRENWCSQDSPTAKDNTCYPSAALAMTTFFKNRDTGEMLDADIVFNAVNYTWGDLVAFPDRTAGATADFQNALTHELGHVIGLDHACYAPADNQPRLLDNTGQPEVDCDSSSLPASVASSTMYPSVSLIDTQRRVLSPDDQQGACDIYPYANATCPQAQTDGGCSTLPSRSAGLGSGDCCLVLAAVSLALLTRSRRRCPRRI